MVVIKLKPKILTDDNQLTSEQVKKAMEDSKLNEFYEPLYDDQKNIKNNSRSNV